MKDGCGNYIERVNVTEGLFALMAKILDLALTNNVLNLILSS